MREPQPFTDAYLKSLKLESKRYSVICTLHRDLVCRVYTSGTKVLYLRAVPMGAIQQTWFPIGDYPTTPIETALQKFKESREVLKSGQAPALIKKTTAANTVEKFVFD